MSRPARARLALAALPLVPLLLLTCCGSSSTPRSTSSASTASSASAGQVQVITVTYAGGKITPPEGRVPVTLGGKVEIRVTSDVAETVHNHFNNDEKDVAAGGTVVFDFTADMPGVYEVELHKANKLLLELQVQ